MYRDQQVRPTFIDDDDIEREARNIYKQTQTRIDAEGGMVHPQHILVALSPPMVIIIGSAVWAKALPAVSDIATNSVFIFILSTRMLSVEFALYLNR